MNATTLYLANGMARTVKGRAEDVGAALRRRNGEDDRIRQFIDLDGETVTVNADAIAMVSAAEANTAKRTFGFSRALEMAA
jgi:hypothetical protein